MAKYLIILLTTLSLSLSAQVTSNVQAIEFPEVFTNSSDSISFYIINKSQNNVIIKMSNLKDVYTLSDTMISISSFDSSIVWVKYSPDQNVIDNDLIFITSDDSLVGTVISLSGSGKFGDSYDATTFNLYDIQLKNALTQLVSNHYSLGYNLARDKMFMEIDNQKVNGQGATVNTLECVYTGRLAVGYTSRTDAQSTTYNFNTEHTWPQSNFSEAEPMKSDLYHLYPTDVTANSMRANYPFGNVVSNITWQNAGSKLGTNNLGQIVFEPRDVHKGNVSRSMFYFITCYPINYGGFFTQTQENVFRQWNKLDPVDLAESNRNNAIAALQLKRNPFIDHPEFVERIYSFATNNTRPTFAKLNALPFKINFDSVVINNFAARQVYITNEGNAQLVIDSITISDANFMIDKNSFSVPPFSVKKILLQFNPEMIKSYHAVVTVYSNVGTKTINITGIGKDNTVNVNDKKILPLSFSLEQNYPNPFNPSTKIIWQSPVSGWQTLKVYDLLGREVATLIDEYKQAGKYEIEFNLTQFGSKDFSAITSGVYFYQLRAGDFIQSRKMILMK